MRCEEHTCGPQQNSQCTNDATVIVRGGFFHGIALCERCQLYYDLSGSKLERLDGNAPMETVGQVAERIGNEACGVKIKAGGVEYRMPFTVSAHGEIAGRLIWADLGRFPVGTQVRIIGDEGVEFSAEVVG